MVDKIEKSEFRKGGIPTQIDKIINKNWQFI